MTPKARRIGSLLLFLFSFNGVAAAQSLEALVSPGPLSRAHSHLSGISNCEKCHTPGEGIRAANCLGCHEDLAHRIDTGKGYHKDKSEDCGRCHQEHSGEDAQLLPWNPREINHNETGYPLVGLHVRVTECDACHKAPLALVREKSRSFLLNSADCSDCHEDVHGGQLGSDCLKCHSMNQPFRQYVFDHSTTRFPLAGAHRSTECLLCHRNKQWTGLKFGSCLSCHKDAHSPSLGKDCAQCHQPVSWRVSKFDHSKTSFLLEGKHAAVACEKCHTTSRLAPIQFNECRNCHRDDPHAGQFSQDCDSCHTVEGFKPTTFNHDRSSFTLTGRHREIACSPCHKPEQSPNRTSLVRYRPLGKKCLDCHRDVHLGQLTQECSSCHKTDSFHQASKVFDHDSQSRFHLIGAHRNAPCSGCHRSETATFPSARGTAVRFKDLSEACQSCHDDVHAGQFASPCQNCHGPEKFLPAIKFAHDRTRFQLDGKHRSLLCEQCHPKFSFELRGQMLTSRRYQPTDPVCSACHEDRHGGGQQRDCTRCHSTRTFSVPGFDHSKTNFQLTGRHEKLDCFRCHIVVVSGGRAIPTLQKLRLGCEECHVSPHSGNYAKCISCHHTKSWEVEEW